VRFTSTPTYWEVHENSGHSASVLMNRCQTPGLGRVGTLLAILTFVSLTGCCLFDSLLPLIPGGAAYEADFSKFGSGEQVITPRDDNEYSNGQPMDLRHKH